VRGTWHQWRWKRPRSDRLKHKIEKIKTVGQRALGVEFLHSEVFSGDHGLAVIEHAPFGVIGTVTPGHSLAAYAHGQRHVSMVAAGNTVVFNPHPSGKRVATEGVRRYNEAISKDLGIDNLICIITEPTLDSAGAIFKHPDINLLCVTGGTGSGQGRHAAGQAGNRGRPRQSAGGGR